MQAVLLRLYGFFGNAIVADLVAVIDGDFILELYCMQNAVPVLFLIESVALLTDAVLQSNDIRPILGDSFCLCRFADGFQSGLQRICIPSAP
jgi:hypothetical protein